MFKPCTKLADELRELNCRSLALRFVCWVFVFFFLGENRLWFERSRFSLVRSIL